MDRLLLLRLLPRTGDLTTLRIVRDLERELSFSEEEHAALQFVNEGNSMRWNQVADTGAAVEFGDVAVGLVHRALYDAETSREQFPIGVIDLCEKFNYEPPEEQVDGDGSND
jgi:hypothetical protein